jgi:hypothetical protein
MVDTPMLHSKYLHLRNLSIALNAVASYDFFSLVSFFDACPSLENFVLDVSCLSYFYNISIYHRGTITMFFSS